MIAVGLNSDDLHYHPKMWMFGLKANNIPLSEEERDIRLLFLRILYRRMQLKDNQQIKFSSEQASRELAYELMKRIQNFQMERQRFHMSRKDVVLKHGMGARSKHVLPKSAAERVQALGKLNTRTGVMTINQKLRTILKKQKVWAPLAGKKA